MIFSHQLICLVHLLPPTSDFTTGWFFVSCRDAAAGSPQSAVLLSLDDARLELAGRPPPPPVLKPPEGVWGRGSGCLGGGASDCRYGGIMPVSRGENSEG